MPTCGGARVVVVPGWVQLQNLTAPAPLHPTYSPTYACSLQIQYKLRFPKEVPLTRNDFGSVYLHKVVACEVITEETAYTSLQAEDALRRGSAKVKDTIF